MKKPSVRRTEGGSDVGHRRALGAPKREAGPPGYVKEHLEDGPGATSAIDNTVIRNYVFGQLFLDEFC